LAVVFWDGVSVVTVDADAPPASDKDTPANPKTGRAFFARLRFDVCFVFAIVGTSTRSVLAD
jgi:hypothetical protein